MATLPAVLITGATGQQGGAVAAALGGKGFALRALTRKPGSPAARALAARGVTMVPGDLDDPVSLRRALGGVWGAFAVQTPFEGGVATEEAQGKRFASLAREAGVEHFVYSSVASAQRRTGIPHFESKWRIEETVRALDFPAHVILRPAFFMENLLSPWFLNGDKLTAALRPDTTLQMIAVQDVGQYGALAFTDAARLNRREIDIAGDAVTLPAAAELLGAGLGRRVEFAAIPIAPVREHNPDLAAMLEWFDRVGFDADIAGLAAEFGLRTLTLGAWAAQQHPPAE